APVGATVTIRIADLQSAGLTEVPLGALYDRGQGTGVWVVDDKTSAVALHPVTLARVGSETALVSGGLQPGDRIVV
ncbi:hypothetical protein ACSTK9_23590, partial [Vibrio parahaemolyticus]